MGIVIDTLLFRGKFGFMSCWLKNMKINILYQFNETYVPYAGVSMTSLFMNNSNLDIDIYILGENLSEASINKLKLLAAEYGRKFLFLDCKQIIEKLEKLGIPKYRGSYATNLKLFISDVIDRSIDRILYIDSDTLVTGSLKKIFELDMDDYPVAMVQDSLGKRHKKYIGHESSDSYYNAGIILFNIKNWEKQNCTKRIAQYAKSERAHYMSPDQDLLNVVLKNRIMELDLRYNFQPFHYIYGYSLYHFFWGQKCYYSKQQIELALSNIKIVHFFRFAGDFPWHENSVHPYTKLYDYYLGKSLWKNSGKVKHDTDVIFAIEKVLYKFLPSFLYMFIFKLSYDLFIYKSELASKKQKNNKKM